MADTPLEHPFKDKACITVRTRRVTHATSPSRTQRLRNHQRFFAIASFNRSAIVPSLTPRALPPPEP